MKVLTLFVFILSLCAGIVRAEADAGALTRLQSRWAEINYEMTGDAQKKAYEQLLDEAATFLQQRPRDAELLIWSGIVKSSYAGAKGGLGALKYAKEARADLEAALAIDPNALAGSAYTSLGVLYMKVPGWPIGFGDDKKAGELLRKALAINPDGIDPNFFFGEYLRAEKHYRDAEGYYRKALQAPPRPGRELADQGRRREIETALAGIAGEK
jgi:tetratricopeptide (TPR) repeat protein